MTTALRICVYAHLKKTQTIQTQKEGRIFMQSAINNWPWPAECPPKPWTPEQVEEYNKQQRDKTPEAPM